MRDLFEIGQPDNPMEAARRAAKPVLRHRFYKTVGVEKRDNRYVVCLDGKPVHSPMQRELAVPALGVAETIAAEWEAQRDVIDPARMPLTRLANSIIDGVAGSPQPVAAEVRKYLASDLLFYRAGKPEELRARQAKLWDPILIWVRDNLGAEFKLGDGIVHIDQPPDVLGKAGNAIPTDPWQLGALHVVTTLTGSALIALVLLHGGVSPDAAWQAAHVDEDWNMEQWGRDELALERRAFRQAEFDAAVAVLRSAAP